MTNRYFNLVLLLFILAPGATYAKPNLEVRCKDGVVKEDYRQPALGYDNMNPNKTGLPARFSLTLNNDTTYDGSVYAKAGFGDIGVGGNGPYQCDYGKDLSNIVCRSLSFNGEDTLTVEKTDNTVTVTTVNQNADSEVQNRSVSEFPKYLCK